MIPSDFLAKSTVYTYFKQWKENPVEDALGLLKQALKNAVGADRLKHGRNAQTTFLIVDAQSCQCTKVLFEYPGMQLIDADKQVGCTMLRRKLCLYRALLDMKYIEMYLPPFQSICRD